MSGFVHPPFLLALPGIRFTLRPGWEVTGYEYDTDRGRFGISSPEEPVCQYSFRTVPAKPDMVRIREEVHRRNTPESTARLQFETWDSGMLFVRSGKGERFYASCFDPEKMRLHEWIFSRFDPAAEDSARKMLESVTANPPDARGCTRYALWGLEADIPAGFELEELYPYPGNIELVFENRKHHRITVRRTGLAAFQLAGDTLSRFYQELLVRKKFVVKKTGTRPVCGREAASHEFRVRGRFGLDALLGPWWRGLGEAFLREDENRIYSFEHTAPARIAARESLETIFQGKLRA